jgi:tetratricopeptide (TPR) repeat protein
MRNFLLILIFLQGCSQHNYLQQASINTFTRQNDYKSALDILQDNDPQTLQIRTKLLQAAAVYETELLNDIKREISNQYWGKALYLCEQGKQKLPDASRLLPYEAHIVHKLSVLDRKNHIRLSLAKAELALAKQADLQLEKQKTYPPSAFYFDSWVRNTERETLADELLDLALQSELENDFIGLESCYQAALELNPEISHDDLAMNLQGSIKNHQNSVKNRRYFGLLAQLDDAMQKLQLEKIRELQGIIKKEGFSTPAGENKLLDAENLIQSSCLQYDKQAEVFYRLGDMPKAVSLWQQALVLLPDNPDYQDKLRKARKIMQKMNTLRELQKPTPH